MIELVHPMKNTDFAFTAQNFVDATAGHTRSLS